MQKISNKDATIIQARLGSVTLEVTSMCLISNARLTRTKKKCKRYRHMQMDLGSSLRLRAMLDPQHGMTY